MRPSSVKTTCCYCGVGCGVVAETLGGVVTDVRGDPDHPANRGLLCTKGSTLHLTTGLAGRLLHPELRTSRDGTRRRASWSEALGHVASRIAATVAEHGPDAVAFYVSGQLLTEDYYAFNKLARAVVGTNNIDSNSRLCMSSAVAGYKAALGADAPPGCYEDLELADCLLIAGSNAAWAHPILHRRIEAARERHPDMKVIVVDPRRTATAEAADLHLAIEPGTDVALFHGLLHVLIWEGLIDPSWIAAHTAGYDAVKALIRDYTPATVARICGIAEADLVRAAQWFGRARAATSLYCMGLNQSAHGTDKNTALINLHLATGQIGRPGAGPFSLTGQPNAMGGRETGAMATLYPGHRDVGDASDRDELARLWQVAALPKQPGLTAIELFAAIRRGEVRIVWIVCTNPAQSLPDQAAVRAALARADLVILQEAYAGTETAAYADVLLPATTWAEKDGTMTNSERRVSRVRPALAAPGDARADWSIAAEAIRLLQPVLRPAAPALAPWQAAAEVFAEHARTTAGRDPDITGLTHEHLDATGAQQWPLPAGTAAGTPRLYTDGRFATPDGKARFHASPYRPVAEPVDARHPFRLITARLRDQWHGMTRTGRVPQLYGHAGEPALAMHPADLARRRLSAGDLVEVASRRGRLTIAVEADETLRPGTVCLPMHWGSRLLGGRDAAGINAVTIPAVDPASRQPELKHCAVRVSKAVLDHRLVAFAATPEAVDLLQRVSGMLPRFTHAQCMLLAGREPGVLLRVAHDAPIAPPLLADIDALFGVDTDDSLRYDDARRGVGRRLKLAGDQLVAARLVGDLVAEPWLRDYFASGASVAEVRRHLLAPGAPPASRPRGKTVCSCWNVAREDIADWLAANGTHDALPRLQRALKCGTHCGSCLPEVRRLITAATAAA